jgi:hypothetical protein
MKRCKSSSRRISVAFLAANLIAATGSVFAQTTVDQVLQAQDHRLDLAQQSQERINNVVEGTRSLEDQYRAINKEIDGLKVYNRLMAAQTSGQSAVLEDIALSMDQVDVINRQIFPLMERMIDGRYCLSNWNGIRRKLPNQHISRSKLTTFRKSC